MDLLTVETLDRPGGDDEVRALLPALGADRVLLGGGTWLFSVPQPHLRGLVDLTAAGWTPLTADDEGLTIAATATLAELADVDPAAYPAWPALPLLALQRLANAHYWPSGQSPMCPRCGNTEYLHARGFPASITNAKARWDRVRRKPQLPFWIAALAELR
jgi:hypothetical protein